MTHIWLVLAITIASATFVMAGNKVKQKKQEQDEERRRRIVENLRVALSD
jgi:hypothetical protein